MSEKPIKQYEKLQLQLQAALAECARLQEENARLKALLDLRTEKIEVFHQTASTDKEVDPINTVTTVMNNSSPDEKVALFGSMFRGRQDVYPVRWDGKNGKSGYSPACANEWNRAVCGKPKTKCTDCDHRELLPVTDQVIYDHLAGNHTIGVYPLLPD